MRSIACIQAQVPVHALFVNTKQASKSDFSPALMCAAVDTNKHASTNAGAS